MGARGTQKLGWTTARVWLRRAGYYKLWQRPLQLGEVVEATFWFTATAVWTIPRNLPICGDALGSSVVRVERLPNELKGRVFAEVRFKTTQYSRNRAYPELDFRAHIKTPVHVRGWRTRWASAAAGGECEVSVLLDLDRRRQHYRDLPLATHAVDVGLRSRLVCCGHCFSCSSTRYDATHASRRGLS